jgi:GntR family transcriptional regulator
MKEMGLTPSTIVIKKEMQKANAFVQKHMGLKKEDRVLRLYRLRLGDTIPMMLETRYIREDLCPGIIEEELASSLWKVFENRYGHRPYKHHQSVKLAKISGKPTSLLGINDDSYVFLITGVTYLEDGRAIECEKSLYRSDKYELTFEAVAE